MKLFTLPAVAFGIVSATSIKDLSVYDTTVAEAQTRTETELAPLAAYGMAKKAADGFCLIWENKEKLAKIGKMIAKKLLKVGKGLLKVMDSKAVRAACKAAGKFFKHGAKAMGKAFAKGAKKIGKHVGKHAKKAGKTIKKWGKKLKFFLAQQEAARALAQSQADLEASTHVVSFAQMQADEQALLQFKLGSVLKTIKKKTGQAIQLMLKVVASSPWGGELEKAKTIIKFIDDLRKGRKITISQVMDVGCAVNSWLPSMKSLGKFMTASKSAKAKMFKKAAKKKFDVKKAKKWAKK